MSSVQETISDARWVLANYRQVRDVFPSQRTLITQGDLLRIGFKMKVLGIDWRSEAELSQVMVLCYHLGMFEQEVIDGQCVYVTRSQAMMPPPSFFKMSDEQIRVNRLLRTDPPAEIQDLAMELINSIMYKSRQ